MKNSSQLLLMVVPSAIIARYMLSFSLLSTGNAFIDFVLPAMPILGGILGAFHVFLVPLGTIFSAAIQSIVQLIPKRGPTGYAVYFIIFGAIMAIAIAMNIVWRPLGYATTKSKIKKETKEAKKQEKLAKKAAKSGKYQEIAPEEQAEQAVPEPVLSSETSGEEMVEIPKAEAEALEVESEAPEEEEAGKTEDEAGALEVEPETPEEEEAGKTEDEAGALEVEPETPEEEEAGKTEDEAGALEVEAEQLKEEAEELEDKAKKLEDEAEKLEDEAELLEERADDDEV